MAQYERRTYQVEAIDACVAAFSEKGRTSVLLESPVGSGKTYMALEAIHRLQERLGRPLKVGWVAPRRHLLLQMMEANRDLHGDNVRPVSMFEKTPPEVDLVVLDEAHHEATQSCVLLYEKMRASKRLRGRSAGTTRRMGRSTRRCRASAGPRTPPAGATSLVQTARSISTRDSTPASGW